MSKSSGVLPANDVVEMFQLDLKNRPLAALLAWLFPGAGHLYQGRTAKGLLLMICITTTFAFGFYLGEGKVAYATPLTIQQIQQTRDAGPIRNRITQAIDRWPFLGQAGIGVVAIPAIVERERFLAGKPGLMGGWFRPPRQTGDDLEPKKDSSGNLVEHPNELAKWTYEIGFDFELGTIYTVVAGLLNILAVYDAYSGPLVPVTSKPGEDGDGEAPADKDDKT